MKTNQRKLNNPFKNKAKTGGGNPYGVTSKKSGSEDELVVIRDVSTNKDYYLSIVDTFVYSKNEYIVMYNFAPDDGNHDKPELVIMRTEFTKKGDQLFYSIKDQNELDVAFSVFMRRYYGSSVPDEQSRLGVR
ncbi:Protein of unknown function [Oscillospiraceae bacterium]|nr:Protein of unknown function [Oscillospiraceae bacterium]